MHHALQFFHFKKLESLPGIWSSKTHRRNLFTNLHLYLFSRHLIIHISRLLINGINNFAADFILLIFMRIKVSFFSRLRAQTTIETSVSWTTTSTASPLLPITIPTRVGAPTATSSTTDVAFQLWKGKGEGLLSVSVRCQRRLWLGVACRIIWTWPSGGTGDSFSRDYWWHLKNQTFRNNHRFFNFYFWNKTNKN